MRKETVVITGASAGLGRALAREFARHGARIALIARDAERLKTAKTEAEGLGSRALSCVCDVADFAQVEAAAAKIEATFGPIDVWINNAMVSVFSPVREMQPEEYRRVTEVTYLGAVHGTLAALHHMLPRDRGVIVQVGSALAFRSIPLQSAYCAAKHALTGFTESLRCELLHDSSRVHVTEVHLPALNTPQFSWSRNRMPRTPQPVPPIYQPEVAARAIYWAAHHRRRDHWVGWPTVKAIVADRTAPGVADRYLAGYEAQQTQRSAEPGRPDNLFRPVAGDFGAHGEFDEQARTSSMQDWVRRNRNLLGLGAVLGAALLWPRRRTAEPTEEENLRAA